MVNKMNVNWGKRFNNFNFQAPISYAIIEEMNLNTTVWTNIQYKSTIVCNNIFICENTLPKILYKNLFRWGARVNVKANNEIENVCTHAAIQYKTRPNKHHTHFAFTTTICYTLPFICISSVLWWQILVNHICLACKTMSKPWITTHRAKNSFVYVLCVAKYWIYCRHN